MNPTLRSLSLALSLVALVPASAFADHRASPSYRGSSPGHRAPPPGIPVSAGRYVLQPVQRWVPAHQEQVWVPEVCSVRGRHHRHLRCRPGYYTSRWIPGHPVTVEEWVWVPHRRHDAPAVYAPPPSGGGFHASASPGPGVTVTMSGWF